MSVMPYIQPHKGKFRFRRKVPKHLIPVMGSDVIVAQLGTADSKEADRLVVPHIKRTDEMFAAAEAGEWPPRSDQEIEFIAHEWWSTLSQRLVDPLTNNRGGLYDEAELVASLMDYLQSNHIGLAATGPTFARLKGEAANEHHAAVGGYTKNLLRVDQNTKRAEYELRRGRESVPVATAAAVAPRLATQAASDLMPDSDKPISFHRAAFMATKAGKGRGTVASYRKSLDRLVEWIGDIPVHTLTTRHAEQFYQRLKATPSDKREGRVLDFDTIGRTVSNLRQFSQWAVARHLLEVDFCRKLVVERPNDDGSGKDREPYSPADLKLIVVALRDEPEFKRWFALVGLHTGMRLSEIEQLEFTDLDDHNGRKHFHVHRESQYGYRKSTKTESSIRKVPIHDSLIRLGLLDWVASRAKQSKDGRIWPKHRYGRWWNEEFTPTIGVKTATKVFHSFRHGMEDALTAATPNQKAVDRIMGHFRNGMGARYGDKYLSSEESRVIDEVRFNVDLSPLQ
jgi:integrase